MITASNVIKPPMWCPGRNGHELWRGCVLYLPLWEGSGAETMDLSGYGNTGTLTDMDPPTDWVTNTQGRALDFDGTNDYINVPDASCFDITTNLSVFFRGTVGATTGIISKYATDKREWSLAKHSTGDIRIQLGDPADGSYEGSWNSVSAQHFSATVSKQYGFTFDNGTVVIYVNGLAVPGELLDGAIPTTLHNNDAPLTIGKLATLFFLGRMSEVGIWNRALSASAIAELSADPFCMIRPIAG